jgi:hypothetical protein
VNAGDDAHFGHPADRFGGWVEVYCDRLDPGALLDALKGGRYYSTQGPALRELIADGERPYVQTSEAYAIALSEADFDLTPFRGSYCRITVVDQGGRRAWSNPPLAAKTNFREFLLCEVRCLGAPICSQRVGRKWAASSPTLLA